MNLKNLFKVFAFVACVVLFAACETGKGPGLTDEQMKSYMPYSNKKITAICPNCGTPKETSPL